jgi:tetratricopeptide (TPR) repeat protein
MRSLRGWIGALLMLLLCAAPALAGEAAISPEAKRHVELGMQHYEAGRYQQASSEFELAYRLSQRPALLFNIARAEAKLGHEEAAIAFLRRYLEERPDAPDAAAVMAEIDARQQAMASAKAQQQAEADAAEARLRADTMAREQARRDEERLREQAVPPQSHTLTRVPPPEPTPPPMSGARRLERNAGIGLLVAGPVVAAVGIGLGVLAQQTANTVSGKTGDFSTCCASLQSRGQASQSAGIALDVIGAAAAVSGAVLLGLSYRAGPSGARAWLAPSGRGVIAGATF